MRGVVARRQDETYNRIFGDGGTVRNIFMAFVSARWHGQQQGYQQPGPVRSTCYCHDCHFTSSLKRKKKVSSERTIGREERRGCAEREREERERERAEGTKSG